MSSFNYKAILVILILSFLALTFLFICSYRGKGDFFWALNGLSCRGIFSLTIPLMHHNKLDPNTFVPWVFLLNTWQRVWHNGLNNPSLLLQREIPLYVSFGSTYCRSDPFEIKTVSTQLQIDNHLISPKPISTSPKIALLHTHTAETYSTDSRLKDQNSRVLPAGKTKGQVVDVGERLTHDLEEKGILVTHDQTIYDGIYNMAYIEARKGINHLLATNPELALIIDIHRDDLSHLGRDVVVSKIKDKDAATVMLVLSADHSSANYRLAKELANIMNDKYPGLLRRLEVQPRQSYNQDLHPGIILIEIGGVLNTLEEALYTADLLSEVIAEYIDGCK